jgi:dihydrofolate synthase/folylpolyglutamate synthase
MDLFEIRKLMSELNNPEKSFPSILVGGTNGKGSVTTFLSRILFEAGYKVGVYTSPHLNFYRERIQILKQNQPSFFHEESWFRNIIKIVESIEKSNLSLTQFEILTALAFLIFQEEKIDAAVLEVGLGGRLDATNIVEPLLSVVTDISYDHQEYLGNTLPEIAKEKAGIFRTDIPCLVLNQSQEVMEVFKSQAAKSGAHLQIVESGKLISFSCSGQFFRYEDETYFSKLIGRHQVRNGSAAIRAAKTLQNKGFKISENHIKAGICKAFWPARFEIIEENPIFILDGAHNPGGASVLSQTLRELKLPEPHVLILGILQEKNIKQMFIELSPWGETWIFCQSHSPRASSPESLHDLARETVPQKILFFCGGVGEAIRLGLLKTNGKGTICTAGSLTTAGEARRILSGIKLKKLKN